MTNQEFINNLSPKAKEIISSYKPKDLSKYNIKVCLNDEHTRVNVSNPDAYIFEIKRQTSFYDMEYALLHEFYHCVQKDSGFPSTSQVDIKYQNISSYLSSIVLDCDVYDRLLKNGYKENPNILMPDSYSKLYIYYDQHFTGFTGYSFQDGKLTKEGKTIFPDQSASADKEGKILLRLNYINKPLTLFVESNHCKRISIGSHSTGEKKIISTITFGP